MILFSLQLNWLLVQKWNHIFLLRLSWTLHLLFSQPWKTALWLSLFFWPALPPYCTKCHTLPVYTWNNWTGREETSCVIVEPQVSFLWRHAPCIFESTCWIHYEEAVWFTNVLRNVLLSSFIHFYITPNLYAVNDFCFPQENYHASYRLKTSKCFSF